MELVPVMFNLERKSILPILTVTAMCKYSHGVDRFLIGKVVKLIELAQNQLEGKLMKLMGHEHEVKPKEGMIAVRFYLIFRNDDEFDQAITRIRKELG